MTTPVLIFDGDCGFCTTAAAFARRHVSRSAQYAVAPWQELDLTAYGLTDKECTAAAQFIDARGRAHAGHLAIAAALRRGAAPWPPLGALLAAPGVRQPSKWIYAWVAAHRYAMPGGTPACAMPTAR
ncbi:thiol-disulfide oxidoreductase DCC family protein [Leekyejoonella antrihumi]|uniref:thiol-disulfide oxidoreductase DCC family protein n=1 Tax=Leekyejoonella antrihumi TaxID=1660198 RepID=UPI0016457F52|nr:DCC1-like thiol-disulfide oxidoreductase family protein [Leekyejoonella antrihumi]